MRILTPLAARSGVVGLGPAVPQDFLHLKAHRDGVAQPVLIGGGKIPDDAPLDLLAVGLHRDVLGDGHGGVAVDHDEALEIEDALGLGRYGGGPGQKNQDGKGRQGQEQGGALHRCVSVHLL